MQYSRGRTNIREAIRHARVTMFTGSQGGREMVRDFMIIITDGHSNIDDHLTIPEAIQAQLDGIQVEDSQPYDCIDMSMCLIQRQCYNLYLTFY